MTTSEIGVSPLGLDEFGLLAELFGTKGDPSWCWCQYFVTTGNDYTRAWPRNRSAFLAQISDSARPLGVVARQDGAPVGWLAIGPRTSYPRLITNTALGAVAGDDLTDDSVWATTCFVVKVGKRRRGTSAALLAGGVELAKEFGARVVEGHPVDLVARGSSPGSANLYHGVASTFFDAGFTELGRTSPTRPVLRLTL